MANLSITIPDDKDALVGDAFAREYGWSASSGLTKKQFVKQEVINFIKAVVKRYERRTAEAAIAEQPDVNLT